MSDDNSQYEIFELIHVGDEVESAIELIGDDFSDDDIAILKKCMAPAASVLVERDYIDKDYRSAYSGYYSKKFSKSSSRTTRLHLFNVTVENDDLDKCWEKGLAEHLKEKSAHANLRSVEGTSDGYIGNIIIRPTEYSKIGRCLLDPRRYKPFGTGEARGCLADFSANLMGHQLEVSAFPHQSQDAELHICAHTAIWSLFRYLSQRYPNYPEQYPYDIALLNTNLEYGRTHPSRGLYMNQVTGMFGKFGLSAEMYLVDFIADILSHGGTGWAAVQPIKPKRGIDEKKARDQDNMIHLVHSSIASGLPPVVGVPDHAVVACGVEYASDPQVQREGNVFAITDFVKSIVVNDDNFAPYRCVQREHGSSDEGEPDYTCNKIDSFVVPLPDKVFLTAEKAEVIITDLLEPLGVPKPPSGKWSDDTELKDEMFVRSLFCTSSKNYKSYRRLDCDDVSQLLLKYPLPHFLWIGEFSPYSLWKETKRSAVVEVALDATAGPYDSTPYLWIRYPDKLYLNEQRMLGPEHADPSEMVIYSIDDTKALTFNRLESSLKNL